MTRAEAIAAAQARNVEAFRRDGTLERVWAEYEVRPGVWDIEQHWRGKRPLWRRAARFVVETAVIEIGDHPHETVWRKRRRRRA